MAKQAERVYAVAEEWKRLVPAAVLATSAASGKPSSKGRLSNLALTDSQRDEIFGETPGDISR